MTVLLREFRDGAERREMVAWSRMRAATTCPGTAPDRYFLGGRRPR
ncbi:hypothetical protein AB0B21_38200 [Streptomyces rimosus]|nr:MULTISPECIES: hypothetical protein [Streptomyces]